ncbi:unnamed protein product [Microthlaspi erraticum]|uniref:Cytochrome P450 n=1 Tax=Microthlaspi erraticum TaxID=1685480 RepID=A0A6D2LBK9_9BRAS|nr:unnamed protein product [Microthlaspi erraticum]
MKLGTVPTIVVSSPETARQALRVFDLNCCSRPSLEGSKKLSYNYRNIAFSPFDDYWKEVRKLAVQEIFNIKRVHSIQPVKYEEMRKLIDSFSESASTKTPVNLSETLLSLTVSVVCKASFGVSFQDTVLNNERFNELIPEALEILGSFSASDFYPYVGWIVDRFTGLHKLRERSARALDAFCEQMIDLHLKKDKEENEDFVDLLLKLEKDQVVLGHEKFTRNNVKAVLIDILLAGIDTAAITMTWAMTELSRNPRLMKKVQSEIREKFGDKEITSLKETDELEYMKMVIKETWRLHPTTPLLLPREVMTEFEINGYTIPVNTRLQVNVWAIGRDPDAWKDPEVFLPERFVDSDINPKGQYFELLPFGGGRRMCPAMYLGTKMVEFGLANLLNRFDWELPEGMKAEGMKMEEAPGLTINKKHDLTCSC